MNCSCPCHDSDYKDDRMECPKDNWCARCGEDFKKVPVWDLVIEDMKARDAKGRKEYGTPLLPFNGRNSLQDLYEELLDAAVYCKTLLIEHET